MSTERTTVEVGLKADGTRRERRRLGQALSWGVCLALGLLIGWLFRLPLIYGWLSVQAVAWKLGWVGIDPTLVDDGVAILFMVAGVAMFVIFACAVSATLWVGRHVGVPARGWWAASVVFWMLPFLSLDLPGLIT